VNKSLNFILHQVSIDENMPATIPLLHKTPFVLDPRPLTGCASPHAGLLAVARTARALHLPGLLEANVSIKQRDRGLTEAQYSESILLSAVAGGEGYSDLAVLAADPVLEKGLGYAPAQPDAARKFIEAFHDPSWEQDRPPRDQQKTFLPEPTAPLAGLGAVQAGLVQNIARVYAVQGHTLTTATLDADATIIFCEKRDAQATYEGGRPDSRCRGWSWRGPRQIWSWPMSFGKATCRPGRRPCRVCAPGSWRYRRR